MVCCGCVYTGIAGIAYALLRVIKRVNLQNSDEVLAVCLEYIKSQLQSARVCNSPVRHIFLTRMIGKYNPVFLFAKNAIEL